MTKNLNAISTVKFALERTTKGAIRYQEVDEKGEKVPATAIEIGTLYVRKTMFDGRDVPERLVVQISTQ